ncbi:hypothetical protein [Microcoleus sp. PH2017_02_FOX_O_A]|uniref:hypothetical protein n=1 Tax=Microcoleus sp. PH2017_02_FOX_O_A TaxID=2798813 RepID=UPI001D47FB4B|nr:hypothetical protein [Microcoleus sp. PH2017_02_FOX_O_A]MCC3416343.1 hypothetical protein [Microcoleus sp. PH2017_02_FOX_O_A]MCC3468514.1 hypothetical protein [Microcoleus sp. PH2017_06_SFM_O_A]
MVGNVDNDRKRFETASVKVVDRLAEWSFPIAPLKQQLPASMSETGFLPQSLVENRQLFAETRFLGAAASRPETGFGLRSLVENRQLFAETRFLGDRPPKPKSCQ